MIDVLLIYPKLGSMDSMVTDLPLSIIYAASASVKKGYNVKLLDMRIENTDWKNLLKKFLDDGVILAGVSVMTGKPLLFAKEIAEYIRKFYPKTKIVFGGPHVTVIPDTINENYIDFLIRGYGSESLSQLVESLKNGKSDFSEILGLSYKSNGNPVHNKRSYGYENISYKDLPYNLVDIRNKAYRRANSGELVFSLYSSIGCPYKCSFCIHPAIYEIINPPKWQPINAEEVVDHIEYVVNKYAIKNICFIDDTSFPDLKHMRNIFDMIINKKLNIVIEFRGARINELDRMDDEFIKIMIQAGTRVLKVGAESASGKMLKIFKKNITKEQIIAVNRKFSKYQELIIDYNFFCGAPGETYEDLKETKNAIMQLVRENKNAYYSFGSDWKPIPGTELLDFAVREYNYKAPVTLEEWAEMDSFDSKKKIVHPWYTAKHNNLIKMLQMASFVIDDKVYRETKKSKSLAFILPRILVKLYKPVVLFRLKFDFYDFLVEFEIYRFIIRVFPYFKKMMEKKNEDKRLS